MQAALLNMHAFCVEVLLQGLKTMGVPTETFGLDVVGKATFL